MRANVGHRMRRIAQTPRAFENWLGVLADMARGSGGPRSLTFVTRTGQRISCPNRPGARVPIYEIFAEDCYQLEEFLGQMAREPIQVLDIGAHVGAFACRLAAVAPQARIECYEPAPTTAEYLRRNVSDNGLDGRVRIVEAAVAARAGQAALAESGEGSALNRLSSDTTGRLVEACTFDDIVARTGPVDLVKIDCEGGEYGLVFASSAESWSSVRRVVLEYHPHTEYGWPRLREWFTAAGFTVVSERAADAHQGTAWLARERAVGS